MDDTPDLTETKKIAARLRHAIISLRARLVVGEDRRYDDVLEAEAKKLPLQQIETGLLNHVHRLIVELDEAVKVSGLAINAPQLEDGEFWSLGSIEARDKPLLIFGGFLDPVFRRPIVNQLPERAVAFLIEIDGEDDLLERDHHDRVGWHYHYLDWKERRSDTILCWDIRAPERQQPRPLFHEKHGEGRKEFTARPDLWGLTKRASMHAACMVDLKKRALSEFRSPAAKALAVWPLNVALTPAPSAPPPPTPRFASKKHSTRRSR